MSTDSNAGKPARKAGGKSAGKNETPAVRTPSLQEIVKQTSAQRVVDATERVRLSKAVVTGAAEELKKL